MNVLNDLENEVGPEPSNVRAKAVNGGNGHGGASQFDLVNAIPILEVMDWHSLKYERHGERIYAECPGCGNGLERSDVVILGNVHKCPHNGCADAGPSGSPGTRTCVDLTMAARHVDKLTAVKMLAEQFGIELPKKKTVCNDRTWADGSPVEPSQDHEKQQTEKKQAEKKPRTFSDVVNEWRNEGKLERIDTGIHTLDDLSRGGLLIPRRIVLVGAPSAGKTYVEIVLANRFLTLLAELGFLLGILAVDEDPSDITARFAQMRGFSRGELEAREPVTLDEIESSLSDAPLRFYDFEWFIDEAVADLAAWCKELRRPGVLFVDSVHAVRCTASEHAKSPRELVEANLKALKLANEQHGLTVICTAEMNRTGYANAEIADKANKMALAAESRAFEFWAQLQITLQTPKDFGHIVHCVVSKNRGASKGEFWLELNHERHEFAECGNPDENPVNVQAKEDRKLDGKNRKNLADANQLGKFILAHPELNFRGLRTAVSVEPSMGWGHGRLDKALAVLRSEPTIYRITEPKKGGPTVYSVTLEPGDYDA
jgi:KaiC/GvpD/RAD55 family RecA-like ATPase